MKRLYIYVLLSALLVVSAGCQKENAGVSSTGIPENFSGYTATILQIGDKGTKTTLTADDDVAWVSGDKVRVTGAGTSYKDLTVVTAGVESVTAYLTGTMPTAKANGSFMAFYPTGLVTSVTDGIPALKLPETRACTDNTVPLQWCPMFAASDGQNFQFKHLCALLEITVKGKGTLKKIEFLSPDGTSPLMSGNLSLNSAGSSVSVINDADASRKAIVTFSSGAPLNIEGAKFYIALPAATYKTPIIRLFDSNGYVSSHKFTANFTVGAGWVYPVTVNASFKEGVQLWKDGPYWATMNIGAANINDPGVNYAWGSYTKIYSASSWSRSYSSEGNVANVYTPYSDYAGGFCKATQEKLGLLSWQYSGATLPATQDAATVLWGEGWHIPTSTEMQALLDNTTKSYDGSTKLWTFTGKGDFAGKKIVGPSDGFAWGTGHYYQTVTTQRMLWWTSSAGTAARSGSQVGAIAMEMNKSYPDGYLYAWRFSDEFNWGWQYRPVAY